MIPKTITATYLRKLGATCEEVTRFKEYYPKGLALTKANTLRAIKDGFDLGWFASYTLPAPLRAEYERQGAPLWAEYERQKAPLWAEYERQGAPLWAEYERQKAPLRAEYERQGAPLWAEYERQKALLWAEYERQKAPLRAEYERQGVLIIYALCKKAQKKSVTKS